MNTSYIRLGLVSVWALMTLADCSFVVDDAPYVYADMCKDSSGCPTGKKSCFDGQCYPCMPHRLCDGSSICVQDEDTKTATCQPLLDSANGCSFTYPTNPATLGLDTDIYQVGVLAQWPTEGNPSSYGVPTTQAVEVAIDGINTDGQGIPVGDSARKMLAVVCNEAAPTIAASQDSERGFLKARVDHLVEKLKVAAIIGGSTSSATKLINSKYLVGHDTLLLSPSATNDKLTPDFRRNASGQLQQLFWRTVAPDSMQANALKAVLARIKQTVPETSTGSIVSVYDRQNTANDNLQSLIDEGGAYLDGTLRFDTGDSDSKLGVVSKLVADAPRFIIPFGTGEFIAYTEADGSPTSMIAQVELQWKADKPRPWYVVTEGNRGDFTVALQQGTKLEERLIGTAPGARAPTALFEEFERTYVTYYETNDFMQPIPGSASPGNLAESGYDAAYLLAYAAVLAASDNAWPSGTDLAGAINQLSCPDGTALNAQKTVYYNQSRRLADTPSACYNFAGASGALDYEIPDLEDATAKEPSRAGSDIAFWCIGRPSELSRNGQSADQTDNLKHHYFQQSSGATGAIVSRDDSPQLSFVDPTWCADATKR